MCVTCTQHDMFFISLTYTDACAVRLIHRNFRAELCVCTRRVHNNLHEHVCMSVMYTSNLVRMHVDVYMISKPRMMV